MTRIKKTRKSGPLAAKKVERKPTANVATAKTKEKGKGKAAGSRYAVTNKQQAQQQQSGNLDPRLGSKKPVALTVAAVKMSPEKEFAALENDQRLQTLLEQMENGELLKLADQQWVDAQLARYQELAEQLGIDLDAEDDELDDNDDDFEYDFRDGDIVE